MGQRPPHLHLHLIKPQQHIVVNLYHPQCMACMMPRAQNAQREQRNIAKKTGHRRKEQKRIKGNRISGHINGFLLVDERYEQIQNKKYATYVQMPCNEI